MKRLVLLPSSWGTFAQCFVPFLMELSALTVHSFRPASNCTQLETLRWGGASALGGFSAPEQTQKQMRRTRHRWDAGAGLGLGCREEHLEVMQVRLHSRACRLPICYLSH